MARASFVEVFGESEPDATRLGGKGAALSRLVQLGCRVPPGFTVTAGAFAETLEDLTLLPLVSQIELAFVQGEEFNGLGEEVSRRILADPMPLRIWTPIQDVADDMQLFAGHDEGVIVRSSATVEDSQRYSFAGIFDSIPILAPEELEPTIRRVWATVFSPRALAYLRDSRFVRVPTMAVVVQRFLEADRSGVMFTRFPGPEGRERILVEHVEGGCEKLVKGEVTPNRVWIDPKEGPTGDVPGALGSGDLESLTALAHAVEVIFGQPQDVEWVRYEGDVHLVQSRPITVAAAPISGGHVEAGTEPILNGVAASPGAGSGDVCLVFNIEQALALRTGQVLVTPMTNPDMVVAMRNSAAIVTDVGGMICHAAIVSRELGLPCVVGTETATQSLDPGQIVTADGSIGAVYAGELSISTSRLGGQPMKWADVWSVWSEETTGRPDLVPVVPTLAALEGMPHAMCPTVVLVADLDLRTDEYGLWRDLEGLPSQGRNSVLYDYVEQVGKAATSRGVSSIWILRLGTLPEDCLEAAVDRAPDRRIRMYSEGLERSPELILGVDNGWPGGPAAVPLAGACLVRRARAGRTGVTLSSMEKARMAAYRSIRFFGHQPQSAVTAMPQSSWREKWWHHLPEYGRYHHEYWQEQAPVLEEWMNVRPELVFTPLLKSLVQPGFEMVPRVMGFKDLGPMHVKWITCRYYFRSKRYLDVWRAVVDGTWDETYMADLMRRSRRSYQAIGEVASIFPSTDEEVRSLTGEQIVALITAWWPRWIELFALTWFIQAQGDDIIYPFIEETVEHDHARLGSPPEGLEWPGTSEFILPTTPVMSGEYMASVGYLRDLLLRADLTTVDAVLEELALAPDGPLHQALDEHLRRWGWMRDRDLFFEPWDTPERVIETVLRTEPHAVSPYEENLRRNLLSLGFHFQIAHGSGRSLGLLHAGRFLHDLNVERENHHVLWLKYSYPVRRLALEVERRLIEGGSLEPGEIFFLVMPEVLDAAASLPAPLPRDLLARVRNRRRAFLQEAKLDRTDQAPPVAEDDYF
jgi:phosphohistidine swiveling domain-containing protein